MRLFVLFSILTISIPGFAIDPIVDVRGLVHKIGDFGERERRNEDEYAVINGTDPSRFSATGRVVCYNPTTRMEIKATAQVTIKYNLITTSAHLLQDEACNNWVQINQCVFKIWTRGKMRDVRIEKKMADGYEGGACPQLITDDWLVLKLAERVEDVEPYQVDAAEVKKLITGSRVVSAGYSVDWREVKMVGGKKVLGEYVKHVGNCRVLEAVGNPPYKFKTKCSGALHSSGGGIFSKDTQKPFLLGIRVDSTLTEDEHKAESRTGEPTWKPDGYSQFKAVTNQFYDRLIWAASQVD